MSQIKKIDLTTRYQSKGAQQISYQEYLARQEKSQQKKEMPVFIKYLLAAPLILVSCFGLLFIPFLIFQAFHAPK